MIRIKKNKVFLLMISKASNMPGFTLIEILIVIAIMGILSSMASFYYHRAIDQTEIAKGKALDASIYRVIGLSVISQWSLKDGTAIDNFSGKNNGNPINVTETEGIEGQAILFNGSDSLIKFPSSFFSTTPSEFTVSLWAKPSKIPLNDAILFYSTRNAEFSLGYSTYGKFYTAYKLNPTGWETVAAQKSSPANKWYHLTVSWSPNKVVLYVNGSVVGERVPTGKVFATTPSGYPAFGAFVRPTGTTGYFPGILDQISLYSSALAGQ